MKFIIGRKQNMTQIFRQDGTVIPVTRIQAGPVTVTQVKLSGGKQVAIQVGFETTTKTVSKPLQGHLKGLPIFKVLKEFQVTQPVERGDVITAETFTPGEHVDAIGTSKGKGFAGVVKRHHFRGGPASHGHKDNLRSPGSIGAGGVQRVFKGMRMAGHMGDARVTVKNLEIVAVDPATNDIFVKGAVPGAFNGLIVLQGAGEFTVKQAPVEAAASAEEEVEAPASEPAAETVAPASEAQPEEVTA